MKRQEIVKTIGEKYLTSNIENDEFSYPQAFKDAGLTFKGIKTKGRISQYADRRFTDGQITVLVETKNDFNTNIDDAKEQLSAYVQYEKDLTGNKIIAILANTKNNNIMFWRGTVSDIDFIKRETNLKSFEEYADYYTTKTNNKEKVMRNTYDLNEQLNLHGIQERLRSQFVGTCLLTLKNSKANLFDTGMTTSMIRGEMKRVLGELLNGDINKANKLVLLDKNVLDSQDIRDLPDESFRKILKDINNNILPFINDRSTAGQDLLNLFFITFNKYVGKADKNQAFTPDHITDFMAKAVDVNRNSYVLDPCCGSGSFLVRAMTQGMDDCGTAEEQERIKKSQIYGIEYDENVYGLATTNMLIHGDGNSNIHNGSCFDMEKDVKGWKINTVLMNPPYNGTRKTMPKDYVKTWGSKTKQDPSKGMYFVKWAADTVKTGKMAVLLPMACAIGTSGEISSIKKELLKGNTLEAVFSLPSEVFYPGASVQACCMVFTLGRQHDSTRETFFGYYKEDGFTKKKNLGRVEQVKTDGTGIWTEIENKWLRLYRNKTVVDGLSAVKCVTGDDEWLAEAYMKTDYSKLTEADFQKTINDYLAYLVKTGDVYEL
jgi:type I restriction enzyme M protein